MYFLIPPKKDHLEIKKTEKGVNYLAAHSRGFS